MSNPVSESTSLAPQPRLRSVSCLSPAGLHRMRYWEWGDPAQDRVLLCVHGLTRTGRDFDALARALASEYRVVCPDVVGRGRSDWLSESAYYTVPQYVADMVTLIARLAPRELHWLGTSMGGLIGLTLAGMPGGSAASPAADEGLLMPPITRLILNDIGPEIDAAGLARIGDYLGVPVEFASFAEAVAYTRQVAASFGRHTDEQWEALTRYTVREIDGRWRLHYDPGIASAFARAAQPETAQEGSAILWRCFQQLQCPTAVLRGRDSDLLTPATLAQMRSQRPDLQVVEFAEVGHAPSLLHEDQIAAVRSLLSA